MRKIRLEDCTITIEPEPETDDPKDHFEFPEDVVLAKERIEDGNEWGWCCVKVTVKCGPLSADDYLGACSYTSEEEFKTGGYYEDMVDRCVDQLNEQLDELKTKLK